MSTRVSASSWRAALTAMISMNELNSPARPVPFLSPPLSTTFGTGAVRVASAQTRLISTQASSFYCRPLSALIAELRA